MADRNEATRADIIRVPEEIAARADEVVALALRAADRLSTHAAADAEAAAELARVTARVARGLARFNASA
jgi:hypothetical protein